MAQDIAPQPEHDAVALMAAAVAEQNVQRQAGKRARWAYVFSVLFFPLGLLIAVYYAFSSKPGSKRIALWCVAITVAVGATMLLLFSLALMSLDPTTLEQIKSVNVDDYKALLE